MEDKLKVLEAGIGGSRAKADTKTQPGVVDATFETKMQPGMADATFDTRTQMKALTDRIDVLMEEKGCVVVGIDGSCTSGKSTLAGWLAERYDCNVFHMDDYFLRPEQRTAERFAEPGGNVDRERFAEEVLLPLMKWKEGISADWIRNDSEAAQLSAENGAVLTTESQQTGEGFCYHPYDCSVQALGGAVQVSRKKLNIVEGSYCLHPELEHAYDLKVLLAVHPEVRKARILQRPEFLHERFFNEWIPMEQMYFNSSNITERCDIILVNIDLADAE